MNRMEELHSLSKNKDLSYTSICMEFMVSIGANPITSIWDEKQFPLVANGYPLSGGMIFKKQKDYAPTLARTD